MKAQAEANKLKKQAAELENARIKRAATSGKRSTPKPASKKAASETYAESLKGLTPEQTWEKIIDDSFG